jgi:hypothetical protein
MAADGLAIGFAEGLGCERMQERRLRMIVPARGVERRAP